MAFKEFPENWKLFFHKSANKYIFILTIIIIIVVLNLFGRFLVFVENRHGVVLHDPLFDLFKAMDFNTPIFILIYGSLITGLISLTPYPERLMLALQTYSIMVLFRFASMYLTPLEVPEGIINLRDPLVFTLGTGQTVTKDLFFSGHIASLTILFLTAKNNFLKGMYLAFGLIVATLIFMQKAHYTIDMIAAPFFAFAAYSIAKKINQVLFKKQ